MNWKGVRVLVTGAGGFIGSHLAERLALEGARVRALVRYNGRNDWGLLEKVPPKVLRAMDVRLCDIADAHLISKLTQGQEVVFHLAALIAIPYSYQAPASFVETNVRGTLNVLEAGLRHKVKKIVHASTSEVYGTARYVPIDEKHPLQGQSPYSASKIGADMLAESFHRSFGLPVATVRPFNTFGPRQSARAVIPAIMSQLLRSASRLRLGALDPVRDLTYVADTVEGFMAAAASPASIGQVIQFGTGRGISIGELARLIMRLSGLKASIGAEKRRFRPAQSEVRKLLCDNRKAWKLLGWRPRYTLEEGLVHTLDDIQRRISSFKEGYAV